MTTSAQHTFTLNVPPHRALNALSSATFEIAQQTARSGTLSATVEDVQHDGHVLSYALHAVEHARGWRGVDTTRTETSVTRVRWDLSQRRSAWSYEGSQARLARVWGSTAIQPNGAHGCTISATCHIEIRVPLLGGRLERLLINVLTKHLQGEFERIARQHCA